ncbi:MAG: nuclease-related domain-containing protein [Verrucomicrobiales bacterium]|nr:nuclease-related domain-containing protein [Verrucomicrobiales bacterium]
MPFESFLAQSFEFDHENEQFQRLVVELDAVFGAGAEQAVLLGNVMGRICEFDAVFIKENAFCVIEMKSMGGEVAFDQNGPWKCGGREIKAGKYGNPFRQARAYRFDAMERLTELVREGALQVDDYQSWSHISACVLFGPPTKVDGVIPNHLAK